MIYIYRKGIDCPHPWAEIGHRLTVDEPIKMAYPIHPGELVERVKQLIASGKDWATQSDIVLAILGWMVRTKQLTLPLSVTYVKTNGELFPNPICADGSFLYPWPEEGFESISEAAFHYRYCKA